MGLTAPIGVGCIELVIERRLAVPPLLLLLLVVAFITSFGTNIGKLNLLLFISAAAAACKLLFEVAAAAAVAIELFVVIGKRLWIIKLSNLVLLSNPLLLLL